ncbi:MAG: hypothetical protein ACRDRX_10050 [Pseudonocardiaceae bacterium]
MTTPRSPTSPEDTTRTTDLNLAHVAAAALAAVTTAVLGSTLGAAGTLIGAAGASVITTVGTAFYRSSLERSRRSVRALTHRTRPAPSSRGGSRTTEGSHPAATQAPLSSEQLTHSIDHELQSRERSRRIAMLRGGAMIVGTLGAFLLAMMLITGFEWASGQTVGGNGNGTTIERVITNQPSPSTPPTPSSPHNPNTPTPQTPTETPQAPDPDTTPDGGTKVEPAPPKTSDRPAPSEVTPTSTPPPPLLPPVLPGLGD